MMEMIQILVLCVGVYIALTKVTAPIQRSVDELTKEVKDLLQKVTHINANYVTEEECAERRQSGICKKD